MELPYSIAIDFDGTVTEVDVIDEVLSAFARPQWHAIEDLWEQGVIGSRQCLEMQMGMVEEPLEGLLDFIDQFPIDPAFSRFVQFMNARNIPFAIVSDGFQVFIDRLLANAGIYNAPVLANVLTEEAGRLKLTFPYSEQDCASANCKCSAVTGLSQGGPLVVIGDGRSDFCLAGKAAHVYAKNRLIRHCRDQGIPFTAFGGFSEILEDLQTQGNHLSLVSSAARKD